MALQTFTAGQVLTAAQVNALQANDYNQTVSTKTGDYVLVAADKGTRVEMNSASAQTITVNTSLFSAGDTLFIQNIGAGVCTITAGTATVSTAGSLALPQNAGGTLYFTSTGVSIFFPSAVATTASGLTLINTTTCTAVASVSIDSVFSATYANYIIETRFTQNTTTGSHTMKLRVGGVDAAGNWRGGGTFNYATSNTLTSYRSNGGADFAMGGGLATDTFPAASFTLFNPFVASTTSVLATGLGSDATASFSWNLNAYHDTATAYDGIKFTSSAGTITGTIRIYGLRNSV